MIFKMIAGGAFINNQVYQFVAGKEPPLIVSDENLEEVHGSSKFVRVDVPPPPTDIVPGTNKPVINLAEMVAKQGMPAGVEPAVEAVDNTSVNQVNPANPVHQYDPPVDTVSNPPANDLGEDVTEDFPTAVQNDLVVFRRKGRFFVRHEDNTKEVVGAAGGYLGKKQVANAIVKYEESLAAG